MADAERLGDAMTAAEAPAYDYAEARRPRGPAEASSWATPCPRCHGCGWLRGDWLDTSKGRQRELIRCACGNARRGKAEDIAREWRGGER